MKKSLLILLSVVVTALWAQGPINLPRVYIQKLLLDTGETPPITWDGKTPAPEYLLTAYIRDIQGDTLRSDVHPHYTICVKRVGDGRIPEPMVVAYLQLGNFKSVWQAGQTIVFEITHVESGENMTWELLIPKGTNLLRHLDEALTIPPFSKKPE